MFRKIVIIITVFLFSLILGSVASAGTTDFSADITPSDPTMLSCDQTQQFYYETYSFTATVSGSHMLQIFNDNSSGGVIIPYVQGNFNPACIESNALGVVYPSLSINMTSGVTYTLVAAVGTSPFTGDFDFRVMWTDPLIVPDSSFTYSANGLTVDFTDTSTEDPTSWAWTFGDGGTSSNQHPTHTYTSDGSYEVCLTASNDDGNDEYCDTIVVSAPPQLEPPDASFTYIANGLTVDFTDTSSGGPTVWAWTFGDGGTSSNQHPTHTYTSDGSYEVCLTASNDDGNDEYCDTIVVSAPPQLEPPDASFTYIANGLTVDFTDTSSGGPTVWAWTFGDGGTSSNQHPTHTYGYHDSFEVCLTVSNNDGDDTDCQTVQLDGPPPLVPIANFTYSTNGLTVDFMDGSAGIPTVWAWTFGDGGTSSDQHPTHTYTSDGSYEVCLMVSNGGGNDTNCKTINVADGQNSGGGSEPKAAPQRNSDPDGDGIPSSQDNCPDVYNPGQEDGWGTGAGDACDTDWYNMSGIGVAGFPQKDHSAFHLHGNCAYMPDGDPRCPEIAILNPASFSPEAMPVEVTTGQAGTWSVWVHYLHSSNGVDVYQVNVYSTNPPQPDTLVDDRLEIHVSGSSWRWYQRGGRPEFNGI